jgi:hypothetical protein
MTYSIASYLDALFSDTAKPVAGAAQVASEALLRRFALVDVGQLVPLRKPLRQLLGQLQGELLFEPSAGAEALEYSPRLIELGPEPGQAREQAASLDAACSHLPALSILEGRLTAEQLLQRLRHFMWVEADRTSYLLRLADTQSMQAVAAVLNPRQRAQLFTGVHAWWCVDYEGRLIDLARSGVAEGQSTEGVDATPKIDPFLAPFRLDAAQTSGVMRGTEVPMFAAQIRHFEPSFGQHLSHAQQAKFASDFLDEARLEAYEEAEMLGLARARWKAVEGRGEGDA